MGSELLIVSYFGGIIVGIAIATGILLYQTNILKQTNHKINKE